jgi:hypothetical protein
MPVMKVKQGRDIVVGADKDMAPAPPIAPIGIGGTGIRRLGISITAIAAIATLYGDCRAINKQHPVSLAGTIYLAIKPALT